MTAYLVIVSAFFLFVLYETWADNNNHFRR